MDKQHEDNPASIKYYVKKYILNNQSIFKNKIILDLPAGSGITTKILKEIGAKPRPYDLFPEFFHQSGLKCKRCDISHGIPEKDSSIDVVFCQEGMEHFPDQYKAFKEINRILKKNGFFIITTPNYSSLQSRFSYFIFESENHKRFMPPNEYETVWFSEKKKNESPEYYFGHAFLVNIQKMRFLWKISGFELKELVPNRIKTRNILMMVWYPLIYISSLLLLRKTGKKKNKEVYEMFKDQFHLNTSLKVLLHSHLFLVLKKTGEFEEAYEKYKNQNEDLKINT